MNDTNATPPMLPNAQSTEPAQLPQGANPEEQTAIPGLVAAIEALLRQPRRVMYQLRQPGSGLLIGAMLLAALVSSLIYGLVVGTFSGGQQLWAAPVKIALGMFLSALICLPSLYIFSCLNGSQARLSEVFGLVAGMLALMTVLLIGFAPVAWVFSQSTDSVAAMGAFHLVFWFVSTYFGLRFLDHGFARLSGKSGGGLKVWAIIFLLVALQMTTALRPLVGKADALFPTEKKFFINHWSECLRK